MEEGVEVIEGNASGRERSLQNLVPFKPGVSGNPLGGKLPAHTLAQYIRDKTLQGTALADFLFSVVNGRESIFLRMADRVKAVELLLNRGWGQAPQTIVFEKDANNRPLLDLTKLTPAEFEQFKSLALKIAPEPPKADAEAEQSKTASQEPPQTTISKPDDPQQGGK